MGGDPAVEKQLRKCLLSQETMSSVILTSQFIFFTLQVVKCEKHQQWEHHSTCRFYSYSKTGLVTFSFIVKSHNQFKSGVLLPLTL